MAHPDKLAEVLARLSNIQDAAVAHIMRQRSLRPGATIYVELLSDWTVGEVTLKKLPLHRCFIFKVTEEHINKCKHLNE
jgi:hypothetical protein